MQLQHRCFEFTLSNKLCHILRTLHGLPDQLFLFAARRIQYEIGHFRPIAGMTYAYAQTPEIAGAEMRDDILQAIMSAMTAAQLELGASRGQV